jgi:putative OPT family oligopeptide transporter
MAHLSNKPANFEPFVPAKTHLPEITVRGVVLGIILAILLAASSTYVGLKIARTIAGSIPAALVSMMILRRFRGSNILENNMVQTIASAGEVVAAGAIFTLPALIIMGYWQSFDYIQTASITIIGGTLGVLFSVPLRRSMVVEDHMPYPEGLATAEVLIAGEDTKGATKALISGSLFSAFIAFMQQGFKIAGEQLSYWTTAGTTAFGGSVMLSPVMLAAGYIVGMRGLLAFLVGGLVTWGIAIPWFISLYGLPEAPDLGSAMALVQKNNFRYVGVGILAIGGIWSVISLTKQISKALSTSFRAMKSHKGAFGNLVRTDRDVPFKYVLWGILGISVPTFFLFFTLVEGASLELTTSAFWGTVVFATLFSLVIGFICAAIAAYIVGIVGTTSLPISGITIVAIIAFATVFLGLVKGNIDFAVNTDAALRAASVVIIFAAVICVAASVSGDNMQDLKAGYVVGATPWKQQVMLIVGVVASALVIPLILQTTFQAYGIGDILPRAGMDPKNALPAPQATLMATIAQGFFAGKLPWNMIGIGIGLGLVTIVIDEILKRKKTGFRFPPLLFALGVYLPLSYVMAFFVGGLVNSLVKKSLKTQGDLPENSNGILFASGIIAGEAILGALLTIPFAAAQSTDIFALNFEHLKPFENLIGFVLYIMLCILLYKKALRKKG